MSEQQKRERDSDKDDYVSIPHNRDAERAALGAMIFSEVALNDVLGGKQALRSEHLYKEKNRIILDAIRGLHDRGDKVDRVTVLGELERVGQLDRAGGRAYLTELADAFPSAANVKSYAAQVRDRSGSREVMHTANLIRDDVLGGASAGEVLSRAYSRLDSLDFDADVGGPRAASELAPGVFDQIKAAHEGSAPSGLATGLRDLDEILKGLKRGSLVIVAARPQVGKSALSLNVAQNAASDDMRPENASLIFSLEMDSQELVKRMLSRSTTIPTDRLDEGEVYEAEWDDLLCAIDGMAHSPVYIDDTAALSTADIRARARRLSQSLERKGEHLALVVVDYIQIVRPDPSADNRNQQVAAISRDLKLIARDLDVPVLALSQLSRNIEYRADKRPVLADLRDSGGLEADADVVLGLYRDEVYDPDTDDKGVAELLVRKHRNGKTGTAKAAWMQVRQLFGDLASTNQVPPSASTSGNRDEVQKNRSTLHRKTAERRRQQDQVEPEGTA